MFLPGIVPTTLSLTVSIFLDHPVILIFHISDSDKENLHKETLEHQYKLIKHETNTSTVCQFGDLSIAKMKVADFQGEKETINFQSFDNSLSKSDKFHYEKDEIFPPSFHNCGRDAVPGPEVPRIVLEKRLKSAETDEERNEIRLELKELMDKRNGLISTTKDIINHVTNDEEMTHKIMTTVLELTKFDCHKSIVEVFHDRCYNLGCNGYALRQINHFATMCELGYDEKDIIEGMGKYCHFEEPVCGIH